MQPWSRRGIDTFGATSWPDISIPLVTFELWTPLGPPPAPPPASEASSVVTSLQGNRRPQRTVLHYLSFRNFWNAMRSTMTCTGNNALRTLRHDTGYCDRPQGKPYASASRRDNTTSFRGYAQPHSPSQSQHTHLEAAAIQAVTTKKPTKGGPPRSPANTAGSARGYFPDWAHYPPHPGGGRYGLLAPAYHREGRPRIMIRKCKRGGLDGVMFECCIGVSG